MIEKLSNMVTLDANGMQKNVISHEELRDFIKKFIGIPLDDEEVDQMLAQPIPGQPQQSPQGTNGQQPMMQNADSQLSMNGNPMMSALPRQGV
jgi:hypothetical protein